MLKSIRLQNFRGFNDHLLPVRERTVISGVNNAGKSTAIEALRLISLVANRYKNLNYVHPPYGVGIPPAHSVVSPSLGSSNLNFDNLFYMLGQAPAIITAEFNNDWSIEAYLTDTKKMYAVIRHSSGRILRSKAEANQVDISEIHILPQVAPLSREETLLTEEHVRSHLSTALSAQHFRNQLHFISEAVPKFKELAAQTWPHLRIGDLVVGGPFDHMGLLVHDGDFAAEVAWMGHGLQIWLQTIWFLARTSAEGTVVLDEPDVYLHPDLQRRLFRLVRSRYGQVIVATHSIEIMAEADPSDILVIDRKLPESEFAADNPSVQALVDHLGSAHNVNLARLHNTKRFLLVEGDDFGLISYIDSLVFPGSDLPIATVPSFPIGGWGGWDYAVGSKMTLQKYVGGDIVTYCLLDRDYHTPTQIAKRYEEATARNIQLHIWRKKEIENYLILPDCIRRVIESRLSTEKPGPSIAEITTQLDLIAEGLKQEFADNLGNEFVSDDRMGGFKAASKKVKEITDQAWKTNESRLSCVSGKGVLSGISAWSQGKYGVSFGPGTLLRNMKKGEVHPEVCEVIEAIKKKGSLLNRKTRVPQKV